MAVDTEKGLITPVVTDADAKGLKQISFDMKMLRNKALEGKLMPEEYQVCIVIKFSQSSIGCIV